jgi:hypothetical protein
MHFLFDKLSTTTTKEIDGAIAIFFAAVLLVACFLSWRNSWDD